MTAEMWMQEALKEARKAGSAGEVPIGAVVVHGGKAIARGRNRVEADRLATRHAEIIALERAAKRLKNWRLNGCTLYVTVEPCPMCASAATLARVDEIVFGAPDSLFGGCGSVYSVPQDGRLKHRPKVRAGVLESPCRDLMRDFFKILRAKR
jgi:tRNA(adenine34) deaminase